jgi:glucuronoarabinoxylan endo-1,4-beta-xylanase
MPMTGKNNCNWGSANRPWTCTLSVFIWFCAFCPCLAQNLAVNPGFELGNTSGWGPFGSPTISVETQQVHSGVYAGLVTNRTATWMGISQSFLGVMQAGQTYNVSVWLQLASGSNQTMQITAQQVDGSGTGYTEIATGSVSTGAWTRLSGQFTLNVSDTLTSLVVYFEMPSSATTAYYIDDLDVANIYAPSSGQCLVDWAAVFQRIDGFGASSAWNGNLTATQADMFFSTNTGTGISTDGSTNFSFTGIGLSLLRNHIAPANTPSTSDSASTWETGIMQMAQARGARVWSTPWTPASGFKDNDAPDGGNYLGQSNNATNLAYASQLANYVADMKNSYGINLYALSIQNEPDADVTNYEACTWNGSQIHDFVTNLHNALAAKGFGSTKIILPESQNWAVNSGLFSPTLNDPVAAADTGIIADHDYGDTGTPTPLPVSGKTTWETEISTFDAYDGGITNAIYWAERIHLFMTAAQVNAWHYWWLVPAGPDNEGLTDTNGIPAKRMYALGQFARFVRPNFYSINVTNNTGSALISAYEDSASTSFAIVAINSNYATITQTFALTNAGGISSVTPWLTTSNLSLASQLPVSVTNGAFTYTLPPLSIATFIGQSALPGPPTFSPVADQTVNAGVTLTLTDAATDTNLPARTLNYTLLSAPTKATLNSSNALFTWRPSVSQANTTNLVVIEATDNGTPPLSATNSFHVFVNPLTPSTVTDASLTRLKVQLTVNGPSGPDYILLESTNLQTWTRVLTNPSPALPFTWTVTIPPALNAQYYRVQLSP